MVGCEEGKRVSKIVEDLATTIKPSGLTLMDGLT